MFIDNVVEFKYIKIRCFFCYFNDFKCWKKVLSNIDCLLFKGIFNVENYFFYRII